MFNLLQHCNKKTYNDHSELILSWSVESQFSQFFLLSKILQIQPILRASNNFSED